MTSDLANIRLRLAAIEIKVPKPVDLHNGIPMMRFKNPNGVIISFVSGEL